MGRRGPHRAIVWLRRDLRIADHPALCAALDEADEVVVAWVLQPRLWAGAGANRTRFLAGCLTALDRDLCSTAGAGTAGTADVLDDPTTATHLDAVHLLGGPPAAALASLARRVGASVVVATDEYTPQARRQEESVRAALVDAGVGLRLAGGSTVWPPGSVVTGAGGSYRVFTPYWRVWSDRRPAAPLARPAPSRLAAAVLRPAVTRHPTVGLPPPDPTAASLPPAGEAAALRRLDAFVAGPADRYQTDRDRPDLDATSRLSPYLRFGCLHPRQVLARLEPGRPGQDAFARELCWRDFHAQLLAAEPASAWQPWRASAVVRTDHGSRAAKRFEVWATGRTGYPIVDAGMRQLVAEGFVHNRVRMVVASFLVKDLHLPWQRGARFFLDHLVDGDLASNNHGWQWVAGTGSDAQPFHRIFNPTAQGRRWDPEGHYVRRWVPELRGIRGAAVHEPWRLDPPPDGYPAPVVDHATERADALARWSERGDGGPV